MSAYDQYLSGNLTNYELSEEEIEKNLEEVKKYDNIPPKANNISYII